MKPAAACILGAFVVLAVGLACKKRQPAPPPTPAIPATRLAVDAGAVVAKGKISPEVEKAAAERDIRSVIEEWVVAQNRGDFTAYAALYEQSHFRGRKRTQAGKTTRADWAAWRDDRAKMFAKGGMTVAVEDLAIRTWLDKGTTLRPGVSEARFVQRWRNPRYADHGVKILQLLRTRHGMRILYEDMLTSSPGWHEAASVDAGSGFKLGDDIPVPKTDDEAMALWRRLGITQATVDDATFELDDFAGVNLMAEALLRHGSFVCKRYVDYDECGESHIEWQEIPPETGWDDPCVQREAALWAIAKVRAKRLPALTDALVKLASIPPPEERIPDALVARFSEMPENLKREVVRALLVSRCDKDGCDEWHPEQRVTELSAKSRIALYQSGQLAKVARQAAIDGVDLSRNPDVLVEVYGDEELEVELRAKLWNTLMDQKPAVLERALRSAADDESCPFAMEAIEELVARGKKDALPRAGKDSPERVVCLLLNARDQEWAEREFRKLLPKRGKILVIEESEDEMTSEDERNKTSQEEIPVRDFDLGTLPDALRMHAGRVETYEAGHVERVSLSFDENGLLVSVEKSSWWGCPC